MNIAPVQRIVPFIAQQMSITVTQAKMRMAACCQLIVLKKQEGLMEKNAHTIVPKFVPIVNCSVTE
jgi:hypothetical protein